MSQFTQLEENIFALLENAENTQAYARDLLSKVSSVLERLELAEKKRNEQVEMLKQQAIKKEEERQLEWQAWQDAQAKQYEERKIELETQAQLQQEARTQKWEAWQQSQQQKLLASIDGFNAASKRIITSLDDKIKTVDLSQSAVERKISEGVRLGVSKLLTDAINQSFGQKLAEITNSLNSTDKFIEATEKSADRVYKAVKQLEDRSFNEISKTIEAKVTEGVESGLTAGLNEGVQKIQASIHEIEKTSINSQNHLLNGINQGAKELTSVFEKIGNLANNTCNKHQLWLGRVLNLT